MIKVERGQTEIHGAAHEILSELTCAIKSVYETLAEYKDEEFAKTMIERANRLALTDEKELGNELKSSLVECLNELLKHLEE